MYVTVLTLHHWYHHMYAPSHKVIKDSVQMCILSQCIQDRPGTYSSKWVGNLGFYKRQIYSFNALNHPAV